MNEDLKEKIIAMLAVEPMRITVLAERLGLTSTWVRKVVMDTPQLGVVSTQKMSRGRPVDVYGLGGVKVDYAAVPVAPTFPLKVCEASETAARVSTLICRTFSSINRNRPLTAFVNRNAVYVTTPAKYSGDVQSCIGTYVPSATKRDIYEDYAHHLEGRVAA